jgi:hypothetical protein
MIDAKANSERQSGQILAARLVPLKPNGRIHLATKTKTGLTKKGFERLLTKAAQPLPKESEK